MPAPMAVANTPTTNAMTAASLGWCSRCGPHPIGMTRRATGGGAVVDMATPSGRAGSYRTGAAPTGCGAGGVGAATRWDPGEAGDGHNVTSELPTRRTVTEDGRRNAIRFNTTVR